MPSPSIHNWRTNTASFRYQAAIDAGKVLVIDVRDTRDEWVEGSVQVRAPSTKHKIVMTSSIILHLPAWKLND